MFSETNFNVERSVITYRYKIDLLMDKYEESSTSLRELFKNNPQVIFHNNYIEMSVTSVFSDATIHRIIPIEYLDLFIEYLKQK